MDKVISIICFITGLWLLFIGTTKSFSIPAINLYQWWVAATVCFVTSYMVWDDRE